VPTLRKLRTKLRTGLSSLACALLLTVASTTCALANDEPPNRPITEVDVDAAIVKVKADPNLAQEKTIRTLRWRSDRKDEDQQSHASGWFSWILDLFGFIAQTGRVIVWLAIGVAVALLAIAIVRMVRSSEPRVRAIPFNAPTHVRDLDIRPESLPDDIGAAALSLWEQGEHRAALALLYRGLLSRLVHVYEIPIRHSSTEGDCLQLAAQKLQIERSDYVAHVIRMWQRAIYGAQLPESDDLRLLCNGFATALNKPPAGPAS
jgi:hypothetical protein